MPAKNKGASRTAGMESSGELGTPPKRAVVDRHVVQRGLVGTLAGSPRRSRQRGPASVSAPSHQRLDGTDVPADHDDFCADRLGEVRR